MDAAGKKFAPREEDRERDVTLQRALDEGVAIQKPVMPIVTRSRDQGRPSQSCTLVAASSPTT